VFLKIKSRKKGTVYASGTLFLCLKPFYQCTQVMNIEKPAVFFVRATVNNSYHGVD
jgi:hypothetical protein